MNLFEFDDRQIHLTVYGRTDVGQRRTENQDCFLAADLSPATGAAGFVLSPDTDHRDPPASGSFALGPMGALLLVADGMGGAAAGSVASRMAAGWIYEELVARWGADRNRTPGQFAARLREAVEAANTRIHEQAAGNPDFRGMGTTATVAGVLEGFVYLAHVGDSRAYLVRDGRLNQLTRDQSVVQEMIDAGAMTEEEAEASAHGNVILQALGTEPQVRVDLTYQEIRNGDTIVLCSDGLFRVVRREEIAEAVADIPDPVALCDSLIALANSRGGPDNITVLVAHFAGDGLEDPMDGDDVGRHVYELPEF